MILGHFALACCLSTIFSENRYPLFGIMLDLDCYWTNSGHGTMVDFTVFIAMASATARAIPSSDKG
jgi:hypothetical protein